MSNKVSDTVRKREISPYLDDVMSRNLPFITAGFTLLTVTYVTLVNVFRESESILGLPSPAPEFCVKQRESGTVCSRPDLFAFQVCSGLAILFCGLLGLYVWYVSRSVHKELPQTPEGRVFGKLRDSEIIAAANFTFQFWDFFLSAVIPEQRTAIMMTHHIMASTVAFCNLRFQYFNYYTIFYAGLLEVSSIFLVFIDLAGFFPPIPGTMYDQFIKTICAPFFVLSFVLYRVVMYGPVTFRLFSDAVSVIKNGQANKLRPGKTWVIYLMVSISLPIGFMQLYWLTKIIEEVKKTFM